MQSDASTVDEYLDGLPDERQQLVAEVRAAIVENLPAGYVEVMQYGMISYVVPLDRYPDTYSGEPLAIASLANQKNYVSLYLLGIYGDEGDQQWLRRAWTETGRTLDMGKSCVRFKRSDDVPLDLVGESIARISVDEFIARYERSRR